MQDRKLAQWLQDHTEMLGTTEQEQDSTLHVALYECIIDMALRGETDMVDPVLDSVAAHAVAIKRPLTDLLGVPQRLRERIWNRIGEEIDPEPAFVMLSSVDLIFVHIIRVMIDAFMAATERTHEAQAAETSRLYAEAEQKVLRYATEMARANRELARLEQAKTDFISIAAHELKTPLTLIQGYINILGDMRKDEYGKTAVDGILRGTERIQTILDDMLDLSAIDMKQLNLVLERVSLKSTIKLVLTQFDVIITEREQQIDLVDLDTLPTIEGDVQRVHQIFKQLINNAIKYTPDEGQITISGRLVEANAVRPAWVHIEISDSGVGVAPEEREKIFEKFYRVGDSKLHSTSASKFMGAGPGLGLAIAKGLAEAHGGHIWVESQGFDMQNFPGSTFNIALPLKAEPPQGIRVEWVFPEQAELSQAGESSEVSS